MALWLQTAAFLLALWGMFVLGRRLSLGKAAPLGLALAVVPWLAACQVAIHRQDLLVRVSRSVWPLGEQVLFLDLWIACPAAFMLASLRPWLPRPGQRRAALVLLSFVLLVATGGALMTAAWPFPELNGAREQSGSCLQSADYSCGAASAVNLLWRGAGIGASEREMARACGARPLRGVSMAGAWWGVEKQLRERGLHADLVRFDEGALHRVPLPAMLAVRHGFLMNHMVVLHRLDGGWAELTDPLAGNVRWPASDLRRKWLGEAIVLVTR